MNKSSNLYLPKPTSPLRIMKFQVCALLLALKFASGRLSEREAIVEEVKALKTTWKAGISDKFRDSPLGSHRHLYGAIKLSNAELVSALAKGDLKVAPLVDEAQIAAIPDAFDSPENWPECAKVINDIRDQVSYRQTTHYG